MCATQGTFFGLEGELITLWKTTVLGTSCNDLWIAASFSVLLTTAQEAESSMPLLVSMYLFMHANKIPVKRKETTPVKQQNNEM